MKRAKAVLKLIFYNIIVLYLLILLVDKLFFHQRFLDEENLVINIKVFPKNYYTKGSIPEEHRNNADGLDKKSYSLHTGILGDIKVEEKENLDFNTIDILFMGGSTTECLYVQEEKRFPVLVNQSLDDSVIVVNLSKSGKNSHHSKLQILTQLNDTEIKNLVLMHNINDLTQLLYSNSYIKGPITRRSVVNYEDLKSVKKKPFYIPFNLIQQFKTTFHSLNVDRYNDMREKRILGFMKNNVDEFQGFRTKDDDVDEKIFTTFGNNLEEIISICRIRNINLILMTQFNRINTKDEFVKQLWDESGNELSFSKFQYSYNRFNNTIRELAIKNNLSLIDLDSLIPKNSRYMYDMVHLTEEGSTLTSEYISGYFLN